MYQQAPGLREFAMRRVFRCFAVFALAALWLLPLRAAAESTHDANPLNHDPAQCSVDELAEHLQECRKGLTMGNAREEVKDAKALRETAERVEALLFDKSEELCKQTAGLQAKIQSLEKSIASASQEVDKNGGTPERKDAYDGVKKAYEEEIEAVRKVLEVELKKLAEAQDVIGFDPCKKRLYDDYRSYNGWGFQFRAGYEYLKLEELFENGEGTLDLLIYRDFRTTKRWRFKPQVFFHIELSNAGEVLNTVGVVDEDPMGDMDGDEDPVGDMDGNDMGAMDDMDPMDPSAELESALRFDLAFFFPFLRFGDGTIEEDRTTTVKEDRTIETGTKLRLTEGEKQRDQLGLYFEGGYIEVDTESKARSRYYGGLRWAYHPEWYFDALIGQTEGLDSDRLELRGQFPVIRASDNSRVYLGIVANLGINEPEDSTDEDVVKVYVKWNVDLKEFFQNFSNGDE